MSKLILYFLSRSPSSRSVKYLIEQLGLDVEQRDVEILNNEQKTEEYLKVNPAQTVPALVDGEVTISDSHAIMMYLMDKYADHDDFYPKDLLLRSKVHSMLFFETQFLFGRLRIAIEPIYYDGQAETYDYLLVKIPDSLIRFERILSNSNFVSGDTITIADFSCLPTVSGMEAFFPFEAEKYPKIVEWKERMFNRFPNMRASEEHALAEFAKMAEDLKKLNAASV